MTTESRRDELLEIYKLHAELADRVSQRREGANRLYVSLLVGLVVFLAALLRFGTDGVPIEMVLCGAGILGMLLSVSWCVVIRSYRQLNTGKFNALHELEKELAFPFFQREWELLRSGKQLSRYWKLTNVEVGLPFTFFLVFLGLVLYALAQ